MSDAGCCNNGVSVMVIVHPLDCSLKCVCGVGVVMLFTMYRDGSVPYRDILHIPKVCLNEPIKRLHSCQMYIDALH